MKKGAVIVLLLLAVFSAGVFAASIAGHNLTSDGNYLGDRGLGIGIQLGDNTALVLKDWVSRDNALQYDLGFNVYGKYLGLGVAYLIHNFDIIKVEDNKFPLYFGIKGFAALSGNSLYAGVEVPLGIDWIFKRAPIDIFLEVDPGLQVIGPNGMVMAWGDGLGIRYWFN
ncbi:MAG: hypothetical protein ABSA34_04435 [Candidatus Goldiibacteriota bacterium]|jgi:hypothetical protein